MLISNYAFTGTPTNTLWQTLIRQYEMFLVPSTKWETHKIGKGKNAGYLSIGSKHELFPTGSSCRNLVHEIYEVVKGGPTVKQQVIIFHVVRDAITNQIMGVWLDTMKKESDLAWGKRCQKWLKLMGE